MDWDVIVVGSGAAGMTAALRAEKAGLKVLILEKASHFGGTTALSGGGIWIPGSPQAKAERLDDSPELARSYILKVVGDTARTELIDAYLTNGPEMVSWLAQNSDVKFLISLPSSDWYPEIPGAVHYGRVLSPKEYDGKRLGVYFDQLRAGREEFNSPGGFMIDIFDLPYLAKTGSLKSIVHFGKLGLRFAFDKLRGYKRGTRLTMGNALAGALMKSVLDAGVTLRRGATVEALVMEGRRAVGVKVSVNGNPEEQKARLGIVLASGGFSANEQLRKAYIPYADKHVSLLPYENTGDGMNMALEAGASLDGDNLRNGVWSVVSTHKRYDGYVARYAHLMDMSKPGCIAVNSKGERFGNEASVHFVDAMHQSGAVPAYIISDAAGVKKYGLGMVYPGARNLKALVKSGYVTEAPTLRALAAKIGVDPDGLERTASKMNEYAKTGVDPEFGKGNALIDQEMGDPSHKPNPCLGPIGTGPFFAVKIFPGDGSTTVGVRIDDHSRVLDANGAALEGLYAAGLDANSIWRGMAPAHGCNVGPAMVLGYIAGKSIAEDAIA
ncbi:MAG: FAD-dependent oxidoreductase [Alphaproteobacteria bacterium]|nr:FAD-dependent oxidoreductase [Alphaproteobacteria bacterium]